MKSRGSGPADDDSAQTDAIGAGGVDMGTGYGLSSAPRPDGPLPTLDGVLDGMRVVKGGKRPTMRSPEPPLGDLEDDAFASRADAASGGTDDGKLDIHAALRELGDGPGDSSLGSHAPVTDDDVEEPADTGGEPDTFRSHAPAADDAVEITDVGGDPDAFGSHAPGSDVESEGEQIARMLQQEPSADYDETYGSQAPDAGDDEAVAATGSSDPADSRPIVLTESAGAEEEISDEELITEEAPGATPPAGLPGTDTSLRETYTPTGDQPRALSPAEVEEVFVITGSRALKRLAAGGQLIKDEYEQIFAYRGETMRQTAIDRLLNRVADRLGLSRDQLDRIDNPVVNVEVNIDKPTEPAPPASEAPSTSPRDTAKTAASEFGLRPLSSDGERTAKMSPEEVEAVLATTDSELIAALAREGQLTVGELRVIAKFDGGKMSVEQVDLLIECIQERTACTLTALHRLANLDDEDGDDETDDDEDDGNKPSVFSGKIGLAIVLLPVLIALVIAYKVITRTDPPAATQAPPSAQPATERPTNQPPFTMELVRPVMPVQQGRRLRCNVPVVSNLTTAQLVDRLRQSPPNCRYTYGTGDLDMVLAGINVESDAQGVVNVTLLIQTRHPNKAAMPYSGAQVYWSFACQPTR